MDEEALSRAARTLEGSRRLVVLTGAGLSTESGVPDFRSTGGIWTKFDPSDFEYSRFVRDPAGFWRLRARLMEALDIGKARPNPAHDALAGASRSKRYLGHVTQNIDGLLTSAGHEDDKLVEVHGSAQTVRCLGCDSWFPYEVARQAVESGIVPPPCPDCGRPLKPGTVLFGEMLPREGLAKAEAWMREADAVLVVGSSLSVYPAAALPVVALDRGASLVIVNAAPTPYDGGADALVRGQAGATVPALLERAGFLA